MDKKKNITIGIVLAIIVIIIIMLCFFLGNKKEKSSSDKVYVEKVSTLNSSSMGIENRFAGVVEAQESWNINLDSEKTVKEVYVKVGDSVAEGDKLFAYNTEDIASQAAEAKLELESINNDINDYNAQIATLTAEKEAATTEEAKFDYTTQIQSVQNDLKQSQYDLKSKQLDIDNLNQSITNSVVTSKMSGVVKSISSTDNTEASESSSFMTILATGDYRVKCFVNEQNMSEIGEGEAMIIRSRVDETATWNGSIIGIDTESPQSNVEMDDMMSEDDSTSDDTTSSSKYPFYVSLENTEGLMLGQHVFVEMDNGQSAAKKGLWIYESYIVQDGDKAYVWADNGKGKLEKREVELGKYDEEQGEYKIKSGLKKEDYITWPMDGLSEGMKTVTNESDEAEE